MVGLTIPTRGFSYHTNVFVRVAPWAACCHEKRCRDDILWAALSRSESKKRIDPSVADGQNESRIVAVSWKTCKIWKAEVLVSSGNRLRAVRWTPIVGQFFALDKM
jgi:hypothetical protein